MSDEKERTGTDPADLSPKEAAFGHVGRRRKAVSPNNEEKTPQEKVEKAERLLIEAHEELGHPENSRLGPAIDQLEAHRSQHHD